jgi:HAMP domain-containing protein
MWRFESIFLKSRLGKRMVTLFMVCALAPVGVLAFFSYQHVSQQLTAQARTQLKQENTILSMAILERLAFLKTEVRLIAGNIPPGFECPADAGDIFLHAPDLSKKYHTLSIVGPAGFCCLHGGDVSENPGLTPREHMHLADNGQLLVTRVGRGNRTALYLIVEAQTARPQKELIIAEINVLYLLGLESIDTLPPLTEVFLLDASAALLHASGENAAWCADGLRADPPSASIGDLVMNIGGRSHLVSYRSFLLGPSAYMPQFTVGLVADTTDVLAAVTGFHMTFFPAILLACLVALLLSLVQVRRSLVPLQKLTEGTRSVARRDFSSRVTVTSGDEFEALANAFNTMTARLGRQFATISTMSALGEDILSSLQTENIIARAITGLRELLGCPVIAVGLLVPGSQHLLRAYVADSTADAAPAADLRLTDADITMLSTHPCAVVPAAGDATLPDFLRPLAADGEHQYLAVPLVLKGALAGLMLIGPWDASAHPDDAPEQTLRIANQVVVALANTQLIEELEQMNWNTLAALARTVDAKSSWTGGHSERVTKIALLIARKFLSSPRDITSLHRAGLLHDIGKLAISSDILDKPGRLTRSSPFKNA